MKILLISTYELGHQPFGLASPAAWLRHDGHQVSCIDCDVQELRDDVIQSAELIAFYLPMHTATRLAVELLPRVQRLNPEAHLCCYGLYAPVNESYLRSLGVMTILGGEFESRLTALAAALANENGLYRQSLPVTSLDRQQFYIPQRDDLPPLTEYAHMCRGNGSRKTTGYVEATRGCKHTCRHCPIVPVYQGKFRIVQKEVVLEDIRRQVAAGAEHITFGDPDFLNGPGHSLAIIEAMRAEFPQLTFDAVIKVEHILKYRRHLPRLRENGCILITSAVESVDERILGYFNKGHTTADFIEAVELLKESGIALNPTFVAFTPWTTLRGYREFLETICRLNLVDQVSAIQLGIRLLIPAGSYLLKVPELTPLLRHYNPVQLSYDWVYADAQVHAVQEAVMAQVDKDNRAGISRRKSVAHVWAIITEAIGDNRPFPNLPQPTARAEIPYLNEPWYC